MDAPLPARCTMAVMELCPALAHANSRLSADGELATASSTFVELARQPTLLQTCDGEEDNGHATPRRESRKDECDKFEEDEENGDEPEAAMTYPDGGLRAYLAVAGAVSYDGCSSTPSLY